MKDFSIYFAYGSNLLADQMAERCPDSLPCASATLEGWKWLINLRGVATIAPASDVVYGAVYCISKNDESALDLCEGVRLGAYSKHLLPVTLADGRTIRALVYIDARTRQAPPRAGYLSKCIRGAREWGLLGAVRVMKNFG